MYKEKDCYTYNYKGAFWARWKKRKKRENCYYCSEFIFGVLAEFGLISPQVYNQIFRPCEFLSLDIGKKIFDGYAREYSL